MTVWRSTPYGPFAADFMEHKLQDLCVSNAGIQTGPFGSQLHKEDYVDVGTPIITVEHLGENRILHEGCPKVSSSDRNRLARYALQLGDIVFSRVGSVDRRALVREAEDGWLFSGRCLRVRPNSHRIDSTYLSYFFGLPAFKEHIRAIAVGATMPSLNTNLLSNILIPHPPSIDEQRTIASILGALDDKIDLNRRMNETLEAIARALFKDWFVDFGPTRAKMEGREPYLAPDLWALFPDRLDDEGKPEGWTTGVLGDVVDLRNERCVASKLTEKRPYVPIDCISARSLLLSETKSGMEAKSSLTRFYAGDILFGAMRPYFHKVCIAPFDGTTRTTVFVLSPRRSEDFAFSTLLLHDSSTIEYATLHSTGSTIPYAVWDGSLAKMRVVMPPEAVRDHFSSMVNLVLQRIPRFFFDNTALAQTRDLLLPKLMSGEIRVRDAEPTVEDAL